MPTQELITQELLDTIRQGYRLDWHGPHGKPHWERVRVNGLRLAPLTGADPVVVELPRGLPGPPPGVRPARTPTGTAQPAGLGGHCPRLEKPG